MAEVTVWYLEQKSIEDLRRVPVPEPLRIEEVRARQFQFNRFLYQLVGGPWRWKDKLQWSDAQWQEYAERDSLRTWAAWLEGSPIGYFELERGNDHRVEINYFGLAEKFIGRGFGGCLLSRATEEAWQWDANRVTVNTCSMDHPSALKNYQARGFSIYGTEVNSDQ